MEKQTFSVSDERGRVYERRSGRLVGEKTLPSRSAPTCAQLFAWQDQDLGGVIGQRDKGVPEALADWAWGELRAAVGP